MFILETHFSSFTYTTLSLSLFVNLLIMQELTIVMLMKYLYLNCFLSVLNQVSLVVFVRNFLVQFYTFVDNFHVDMVAVYQPLRK
jgi:hypothetical protein